MAQMNELWRIWLIIDPRRGLVLLGVFLAVLAFSIHFILLSTDRYNWLEVGPPRAPAAQTAPAPR
jgi:light-harvesting complex 1 alpha chain